VTTGAGSAGVSVGVQAEMLTPTAKTTASAMLDRRARVKVFIE
jgi:hypothetical protein